MINAVNVVLDTNVLVSALWSANGAPFQIVHAIPDRIIPHYCEAILREYTEVLSRPALRFHEDRVRALLAHFVFFGRSVAPIKSEMPLPDESDRIFYDTAKTSGSILITGNSRHFPAEPFIMAPSVFITKLIMR